MYLFFFSQFVSVVLESVSTYVRTRMIIAIVFEEGHVQRIGLVYSM